MSSLQVDPPHQNGVSGPKYANDANANHIPASGALDPEVTPAESSNNKPPVPRLCHLRRWEGLSYGFNLISRKGKTGHYIENIEYGLAAYYSGLMNGDRVVEINGIDVSTMPHADVVKIIKESGKDGVKLLVVDQVTEDYFRDKGISIRSSSSSYQVKFLSSPAQRPADVIEDAPATPDVTLRDQGRPRKKSSLFKRFSTPEPPPPLPMDAILPVETVYATLGSADDLNSSMNKASVRPKLPQVNSLRAEGPSSSSSSPGSSNRNKNSVTKTSSNSSAKLANGNKPGKTPKIPNTNSLPSKLRRLSLGKQHQRARLCHLIRSPSQRESYGFVLRTYHDTSEKMIVKLDADGIAARTGIREMDFLIEVDGINVAKENHQQVTSRIRNAVDQISLLVVSPDDMTWFRRNSKVPKSSDALMIQTPGRRQEKNEKPAASTPPRANNEAVTLRTGDRYAIRNLNRIDSESERSSTRMDEFQLSEYNSNRSSSTAEAERQAEEGKKRQSQEAKAEQLRIEHEQSVRKAKQEEEDRIAAERRVEQEWEERRRREEEAEKEERKRAELEKQQVEAEKRKQQEQEQRESEKREEEHRQDPSAEKLVNGVTGDKSSPTSPVPPEPTPRKPSRSKSIVEPAAVAAASKIPASKASGKTQEEKQQEKEDVSEIVAVEDQDLEANLSVSVAEIKKRLAASAAGKKNTAAGARRRAAASGTPNRESKAI